MGLLSSLFSLLSSVFSLLSSPCRLSFLFKPGKVQTLLQCSLCLLASIAFASIRDGLGANKPCCQSIWGSLAAFFVISSLFSLLSSLFSLLSSLFSLLSSLFPPPPPPP